MKAQKCTLSATFVFLLVITLASTGALASSDDYLIYCHSSLVGQTTSNLTANLETRGFHPVLITISNGTSRDWIKDDIRDRYFAPGTLPQFVLLIGSMRADQQGQDELSGSPSGNLIPSFWQTDYFGVRSSYDAWFVSVDTNKVLWTNEDLVPDVHIGRIPCESQSELAAYVNKLIAYTTGGVSGTWRNNILLLGGDKDRGAWPDYPMPSMVNAENDLLIACYVPVNFTSSLIKYSDFSDSPSRKTAAVNALNLGQLVVALLATGSNMGSLGYILERATFDASTDLSNEDKYPVLLGSSCALGQTDQLLPGDLEGVVENMLFADQRGIIASLAPTGFSSQNANFLLQEQFLVSLFAEGNRCIGSILDQSRFNLMRGGNGLIDTYLMYSVLGDPALSVAVASDELNHFLHLGFEVDDPVVLQDSHGGYLLQDVSCGCSLNEASESWNTDRRHFVCEGYKHLDTEDGLARAYILEDLYIPVSAQTRYLTFWTKAELAPGGHDPGVSINGETSSGALADLFSGDYLRDQYGSRIRVQNHDIPPGEWRFYAVDMLEFYGTIITSLRLDCYFHANTGPGNFEVLIDNVRLGSTWGNPPEVDPIDFPDEVSVNSVTPTVLGVTDEDIYSGLGDDLDFEWTVSAGQIDWEGNEAVYTAPPDAQLAVQITAIVSDKGGFADTVAKSFNIVDEPEPGCPVLTLITGESSKEIGTVLTRSEDSQRADMFVEDHCLLGDASISAYQTLTLRLAERENETTTLDNVKVSTVDYKPTTGFTAGFTYDGGFILYGDPILPRLAYDHNGRLQQDLLQAPDGHEFYASGPGYLILEYDLSPWHDTGDGPAKVVGDGSGGPGLPPPDKKPSKLAVGGFDDGYSLSANVLKIWVRSKSEEYQLAATIFPRTSRSITLVDISSYSGLDGLVTIKLEWNRHYSADYLPFFRFLDESKIVTEVKPDFATKNTSVDVTAALVERDLLSATIRPGDAVDVLFSLPALHRDLSRVCKVDLRGYYQLLSLGEEEEQSDFLQDAGLQLYQNRPNPFNPTTEFEVYLPRAGVLSVKVFNVVGQFVQELSRGSFESGQHLFEWDGTDCLGRRCATGLYFYAVDFEGRRYSKKMLLLR